MKDTIIEKITYKSSNQSLSYREILNVQDKKIKLVIKSDSYNSQCHAKAYVLKNDEWAEIYNIPYSQMSTKDSLAYVGNYGKNPEAAEKEFIKDQEKLLKMAKSILF